MKHVLIAVAAVASLTMGSVASAQEALAESSGCLKCHSADTKKKGPAFKATAAKYKGKADAEATIFANVKGGAAEHPKIKASDDDVKSLIKWILTL